MSFHNVKIVAREADPEDFRSQRVARGERTHVLTPATLCEFDRCPQRWLRGYERPRAGSHLFATLLRCLLLAPGQFHRRYGVRPVAYDGREIISRLELDDALAARERLLADDRLAGLIAASDCLLWLAGEWRDEATGLTVPVKTLIDLAPVSPGHSVTGVKATASAALLPWQRQAFEQGYHVEAAFNLDLYAALRPGLAASAGFVAVEYFEPWQAGKRVLSPALLKLGRAEYRHALAVYARCLKTGAWPGYDDTVGDRGEWTTVEAQFSTDKEVSG